MSSLTDRAKEIIEKILYITIATSGKDGKPWNSPVYSAHMMSITIFIGLHGKKTNIQKI